MKRNFLLVFVAILAIAFASIWVWAKDSSRLRETGKTTAIQPTEPNEITPQLIQVKPKAKMMTDLSQIPKVKKGLGKEAEGAGPVIARKPMTYCEVQMFDAAALFRFINRWIYNPYVPDAFATLQDPKTPFLGPCASPQMPFHVVDVSMSFRTYGTAGNSCTAWVHGVVYEADMTDPNCPKPGALLARTADVMIVNTVNYSFNYLLNEPLLDSVCVYQSYFAGYVWDSIPDKDTLAGWGPRFNTTGTTCFDYEDYGTGWYDFGAYAGAGPTAFWSSGFVKDQNTCPPDTFWFFKRAYTNAPCGLPDFEQYDHGFPNNGNAYCGPAAEANCLWWMWARGVLPRFWPGNDWTGLAAMIGSLAQTDPVTGTECDKLFQADQQLKKDIPLWITVKNLYAPDFATLDDELRKSEDIILLLGFWYYNTTPPDTGWKRFGGHFVTMNGVNTGFTSIAISDPAFDNAEMGQPGFTCHTDPFPHIGNPLVHDNPANVSKDIFLVQNSPSPGGTIGLPLYWDGRDTAMYRFAGQNFRTVHLSYQGPVPPPGPPVFTEIEQAIIISPADSLETGTVQSSKAYETENNRGGILAFAKDFGAGYNSGLYYGSLIVGQDQATLNCDYGDYAKYDCSDSNCTFIPTQHVTVQSFNVPGAAGNYTIEQLTTEFKHNGLPLKVTKYAFGFWVPVGGTEDCEQVVEDVFVIENTGQTTIQCLEKALWLDYDVGDYANNLTDFDQKHQSMWMWDATAGQDTFVFGMTKKPAVVGDKAITGWAISQPRWVYDGQYLDSLKYMMHLGWGADDVLPDDKSLLIADTCFDLAPGQMHLEKWLKWGYHGPIVPDGKGGDANWRHFLYNVLHQEGYYRGDVNKDRKLDLADIVYLVAYVFKGGPMPKEFTDQGDVNNDGSVNVADVVYLVAYTFKKGPAPIDKNRFLVNSPFVGAPHKSLAVRSPGLFGDPNWWNLGR
ncbi:MAG: hypothetical protein A2W07_02110 [candidate division Zixibacteria bacterium RBG_16_43_9]|nr:MAG: hypothetical protein A2W07_02110 [candidate division Zixibacteria bacterium RBG_16_43_9]